MCASIHRRVTLRVSARAFTRTGVQAVHQALRQQAGAEHGGRDPAHGAPAPAASAPTSITTVTAASRHTIGKIGSSQRPK